MEICITAGCYGLLPPRTGRRGRPREYCEECRPTLFREGRGNGYGPVKQPTKVERAGRGHGYGRTYESDVKREHQDICYKIVKDILGVEKLPEGRAYASLCNEQHYEGSQYDRLMENLLVSESQYIGFDMNSSYIEANRKKHPNAIWHYGDMASRGGLRLMKAFDTMVIDYDSCDMLRNKRVQQNLGDIFQYGWGMEILVMANVLVKYRGKDDYELSSTISRLAEIRGINRWSLDHEETYVRHDRPGGPVYRTLFITNGVFSLLKTHYDIYVVMHGRTNFPTPSSILPTFRS